MRLTADFQGHAAATACESQEKPEWTAWAWFQPGLLRSGVFSAYIVSQGMLTADEIHGLATLCSVMILPAGREPDNAT